MAHRQIIVDRECVLRSQRMVSANSTNLIIGHQFVMHQLRIGEQGDIDRKINFTQRQPAGYRPARNIDSLYLHHGRKAVQPFNKPWQQYCLTDIADGDANCLVAERGIKFFRGAYPGLQQPKCLPHRPYHSLRHRRRIHPFARMNEQWIAQPITQPRQSVTDRRLRDIQRARGKRQVSMRVYRFESQEKIQIEMA